MKRSGCVTFVAVMLFVLAGCEDSTGEGTVVGSSADYSISGLTISVDTAYVDGAGQGRLVAKGTVRNNGSSTVTSPWYLEGQFYTDASYRTKLGGNYTRVGVPLSRGQETIWTLMFSSGTTDVRQYQGFRVGDLRGIYKR